jgi:hypothetical protein
MRIAKVNLARISLEDKFHDFAASQIATSRKFKPQQPRLCWQSIG